MCDCRSVLIFTFKLQLHYIICTITIPLQLHYRFLTLFLLHYYTHYRYKTPVTLHYCYIQYHGDENKTL